MVHRVCLRRVVVANHAVRSDAAPGELSCAEITATRDQNIVHGTNLRRERVVGVEIQVEHDYFRYGSRVLRSLRHLQLLHILHRVSSRVLFTWAVVHRRA